jgi:hypothetical protein
MTSSQKKRKTTPQLEGNCGKRPERVNPRKSDCPGQKTLEIIRRADPINGRGDLEKERD